MILLRLMLLVSVACCAASVLAQEADESALDALDKNAPPKVIAQNEAPGAKELREAMRRIALRPSDIDALIDAGNAALLLGDGNAALNFFTRANSLQPSNGRIKAGLAAATVRTENPFEALRLFDEAVKLGVSERSIAADRAMAFDLLGNFERAQQDYQLARTTAVSDELIIQQAISLSLAGRKNDADAMLVPLLQKDNASAWRARAFMLAARGDFRESSKVTQGFMDSASAQRMERYLRLMPQLTGAQQAAAIHLGHFPANNIGRDSNEVRRVAATIPQVANPAGSGRLIPTGDPLGPRKREIKAVNESKQVRPALPVKSPVFGSTKPSVKSTVSTELARAKIEEAARASATLVTARDLPVPSGTRQTVKVALPTPQVATPKPVTITPAPPVTAPAAPAIPARQIAAVIITPTPVKPIEPKPIAPSQVDIATSPIFIQVKPAVPESGPGFESLSDKPQPLPAQTVPTQPAQVQIAAAQTAPVSIEVIKPDPVKIAATQSLPAIADPAKAPSVSVGPAQGPMPDGATVTAPKQEIVFASNVPNSTAASPTSLPLSTPTAQAPVERVSPLPAEIKQEPIAAKPFDLGAFVGAIEIPESEQQRTVAAVDLKKIKPIAAKSATTESDTKLAKAKALANPARIWVQIATGPASSLGFDYRGWMKKKPDLFKGHDGWSAIWNKTARLLVGPFADLKAAKKWSADFTKAGGKSFIWSSDVGEDVKKIGSK